jgi:hypothetical protein
VLAIHRNQFGPGSPRSLYYQFTACDQNFLVCQSNPLSEADRLISRFQAGDAHDSRQNEIHLRIYGRLHPRTASATEFRPTPPWDAFRGQPVRQRLEDLFRRNNNNLGVKFADLIDQKVDIAAGDEGEDLKLFGAPADDVQGTDANGPSRAEKADLGHLAE